MCHTSTPILSSSYFTCSGVVDYALGLPTNSNSPETLYSQVVSRGTYTSDASQLKYGDLVFYRYGGRAPGHGTGLGGPSWRRRAKKDVASWHLLAVDPSARGRHVADALLTAGIQAARELGAKVVRISSSTANVPANALYASRGFKRYRPIWLPYPGLPLPGWSNLWELEV